MLLLRMWYRVLMQLAVALTELNFCCLVWRIRCGFLEDGIKVLMQLAVLLTEFVI